MKVNPIGNETEIRIMRVSKEQLKNLINNNRYENFSGTARGALKVMTHSVFLNHLKRFTTPKEFYDPWYQSGSRTR